MSGARLSARGRERQNERVAARSKDHLSACKLDATNCERYFSATIITNGFGFRSFFRRSARSAAAFCTKIASAIICRPTTTRWRASGDRVSGIRFFFRRAPRRCRSAPTFSRAILPPTCSSRRQSAATLPFSPRASKRKTRRSTTAGRDVAPPLTSQMAF